MKKINRLFINGAIALAFALLSPKAGAQSSTVSTNDNSVIAIDILLLPDQTMIQHATQVNTRLLSVFPKGFSLDATHHPHVSMLQRYVKTADLDKVYAALEKVFENERASRLKMKAFKYYYIPDGEIGLAGIVIEPTKALLDLQQAIIKAVSPYTVATGTAAAYVTSPTEPNISQALIDYVATFIPKASGKNFNPHVTVGVALQTYLKTMLAEKFDDFTFMPIGAAVYHLGEYGTAQKELHAFNLKQ